VCAVFRTHKSCLISFLIPTVVSRAFLFLRDLVRLRVPLNTQTLTKELKMHSDNSAIKLPIFEGENYHLWATRMEAYLDAHDLWEAVEDDYEVEPLPDNPTLAQIRNHKERKQRKIEGKILSIFCCFRSNLHKNRDSEVSKSNLGFSQTRV